MLNKLRWRFIMSAMVATFTVLLILLVSVNVINYITSTGQLDRTLNVLSDFTDKRPGKFDINEFSKPGFFGGTPAQAQNASMFFMVSYDADGEMSNFKNDFVSSVDEDTAVEYADSAIRLGKEYGYNGEYRYKVSSNDNGTVVTFLNASMNVRQHSTLMFISLIVAAASMLAVFALTLLLSKRAISPYMKNLEMQKQFITNASHEIKTPLTSIATSADVLAMDQENNEWITNIQKQTVRLSKLVSNLVTLSRLNEETPFPDKNDFSLSDALWETAEPFATLAKGKGKNYTQDIENRLRMVGDRAAIQQTISILLDNAVKYSSENGEISLTAKRKGKKVQIEVYNTCDTVDPSVLDRLFDRFYRPDKSRTTATGGSGIGLAIARATVENHSGTISARSDDGKSIVFCVLF